MFQVQLAITIEVEQKNDTKGEMVAEKDEKITRKSTVSLFLKVDTLLINQEYKYEVQHSIIGSYRIIIKVCERIEIFKE